MRVAPPVFKQDALVRVTSIMTASTQGSGMAKFQNQSLTLLILEALSAPVPKEEAG